MATLVPEVSLRNKTTGEVAAGADNTANQVNLVNAAASSDPAIIVTGSDTNIDLDVKPKGTGVVRLGAEKANFIEAKGAAASSDPSIIIAGSDTDIDFDVKTKGRGVLRLNNNTTASTDGSKIGFQSKPGQSASMGNNVIGGEISPRLNDAVALTGTGSIIGLHVDAYLKGTSAGTVAGDVRGMQIELVTDDAGTRTISGDVVGLRFRSAFSATTITGKFVPIKIEKAETQTNSKQWDAVLMLPGTNAGIWHDDPTTEPSTPAGYIKVLANGNARYIQLYSTAPTD